MCRQKVYLRILRLLRLKEPVNITWESVHILKDSKHSEIILETLVGVKGVVCVWCVVV